MMSVILMMQSCLTLTTKRKEITFTSTPSGADVYRMFNKNDVASSYYIGTTPFTYKSKGAGDAFAFVKDGYYSQVIPTEKKGRWIPYLLGNLWLGCWGYIADLGVIYAYKQDSFNATLIEMPRSVVSKAVSSSPIVSMPQTFEVSNAKSLIKPSRLDSSKKTVMSAKQVYKEYNDAVFMIYGANDDSYGQGSGFIVNSSGLAISNYHNVRGSNTVLIKLFGKDDFYEVTKNEIIAFNEQEDYVIFKLPSEVLSSTGRGSFPFIPVGSTVPEIGDQVYTIGSPRGLENTLSSGEISAHRSLPYSLQINAPIDHGSSGGALINEYGEVVGITSAGRDDSGANLNFAIDLVRVINKYK